MKQHQRPQNRPRAVPHEPGTVIESANLVALSVIDTGDGTARQILYLIKHLCCGVTDEKSHRQISTRGAKNQTLCRRCASLRTSRMKAEKNRVGLNRQHIATRAGGRPKNVANRGFGRHEDRTIHSYNATRPPWSAPSWTLGKRHEGHEKDHDV